MQHSIVLRLTQTSDIQTMGVVNLYTREIGSTTPDIRLPVSLLRTLRIKRHRVHYTENTLGRRV